MFDFLQLIHSVRKLFNRKELLIIALIILLYFITRLINLDKFPIFSDEGIYIHWAKVAWHDATWRFISLTDGKQPLQTWGTIPFLKIFPDNALFAGRLFSVATGFVALMGVFTLLHYLFGKRTAFFGSFFYIFTPYFLFYDRMALVDSGVNASFIWILLFSVLLVRLQRLDIALAFGLISGFALLAKSSVRVFLMLTTLAPILFLEKNLKKFFTKFVNFLLLYSIVIALSLLIYNVQRLSPFFHFVSEKNKTFILSFSEVLQAPFAYFSYNFRFLPLYVFWESGFVIAFLGILGLFFLYRKDRKLFYYFFFLLVIPYIVMSFFTRVLYPRYIIFFASLLLVLASYYVSKLKNYKYLLLALALFSISAIQFDKSILFNPKNIPFPPVDRGQYIEAWPSGWGIKEVVEYARGKSKEKPVILLAEGNFGMTGDVLDVHLKRNDKITIKGYWPLGEKDLLANQKELGKNYVFAVFAHRNSFDDLPLKLIETFYKPGRQSAIYFLELIK